MKWLLSCVPLIAAGVLLLSAQYKPRPAAKVVANYGKLPLALEANRGQADTRVKFMARANAARNAITNAGFHQADLAAEPAAGEPWLRRPYSHVLLDPPRTGARAMLATVARLAPDRVLYISCHPGSLARDLMELVHEHGFRLEAAGVVDMFAHTAHVESLALLVRP